MTKSPRTPIDRILQAIFDEGVILCIRMDAEAPVLPACRAAVRGGLRALEITLTTPGALAAIATLAREAESEPEAERPIVGAGTVLTPKEADSVADAGGRFAMSPVFDREVVARAEERGLLAIPGAATPTEILAAHRAGARVVKIFPAGAIGGPDFLRSVRGPLPNIHLIPTSGPGSETVRDYFAQGAAAVGIGGEVFAGGVHPEAVEAAARRVRRAVDAARGAARKPEPAPAGERA